MEILIDGKKYVKEQDKDRNSGDSNSGDWNSGDWNSGYRNSGDWNSGDSNSGYRNSGDCNSGDWNSGDSNSGYLNTDEPFIRLFNKDTKFKSKDIGIKIKFPDYFYFDLAEWVGVKNMTKAEKEKYPYYETTTGFLRVYKYKEAWKRSFNKATKKDVALTLKLPNFDYRIFEKISGITKKMMDTKLKKNEQ